MSVSVTSPIDDSVRFDGVITGVRDPRRLKVVADADLRGSLDDPDLDAVVATLRLACASPIVVVNIVSADRQTSSPARKPDLYGYGAKVRSGVKELCMWVRDLFSRALKSKRKGGGASAEGTVTFAPSGRIRSQALLKERPPRE
ncbi:hypothetical protein [Cryobacterium sp. TMT2-4]|uniref:hypothetical protein n=1 Tax=Cryobacterium sp. TMT2-4 TaxID=1259254 RepID=UPI00106BFA18|nr:hypothetical protein [Cryobacterium sp. TMT2-4]TFC63801.1 hypothetical protein E3O54_15780 [Cryobacterium sp. TMT2-4]